LSELSLGSFEISGAFILVLSMSGSGSRGLPRSGTPESPLDKGPLHAALGTIEIGSSVRGFRGALNPTAIVIASRGIFANIRYGSLQEIGDDVQGVEQPDVLSSPGKIGIRVPNRLLRNADSLQGREAKFVDRVLLFGRDV
jgi:hypothetical protein